MDAPDVAAREESVMRKGPSAAAAYQPEPTANIPRWPLNSERPHNGPPIKSTIASQAFHLTTGVVQDKSEALLQTERPLHMYIYDNLLWQSIRRVMSSLSLTLRLYKRPHV
ncbi:hypothetical protein BFJ69_g7648 [Fusarium oxysporum]|uniref:Uncharacterized protein n=1 Tax=Fusarium oxysporum TaxID=5507 RepID=A0A420N5V0_FUSOX|nr:hypothetical protein BFJ69_g7648 [Fusarium oxysporum]